MAKGKIVIYPWETSKAGNTGVTKSLPAMSEKTAAQYIKDAAERLGLDPKDFKTREIDAEFVDD